MIYDDMDRETSYRRLVKTLEHKDYHENAEYNPLMIAFEITTHCNFHCIRCERNAINPSHLNHHMSEETFDRLSPLFSHVRGVSIVGGLGEPLLAPRFWNMVETMKRAGAQVQYFTNGSSLTDKTIIRTFESEIDAVAFSIDGFSPEVYERLKTGAKYSSSMERIDAFLRLRNETGADTKLMLNCAIQKDTLNEMIPLLRFGADRGADRVWFTGVITHTEEEIPYSHLHYPLPFLEEHFNTVKEEAEELGIDIRLPASVLNNRQICTDLWTNLYIFYNGDVCACPHFRENKKYFFHVEDKNIHQHERVLPHTILGNVNETDILSFWNGPEQRRLRKDMLSQKTVFQCRGCHFSYDLH